MAIRKDVDDMLNNLNKPNKKRSGKSSKKSSQKKPKSHISEPIDTMSVDDILISMDEQKNNSSGNSDTEKTSVPADSEKKTDEAPAKPKKKIVISGELPDYDALREMERQKDEQRKRAEETERNRIEAEKKAAEDAEKKRIEAEKKAAEDAEKKRIEEEKKTAEENEEKADNEIRISIEEIDDFSAFDYDSDNSNESDPVGSLIDTIREDAEKAVADIEKGDTDSSSSENNNTEIPESDFNDNYESEEYEIEESDEDSDSENSYKISEVLENILDEDPDDIINERSEKNEPDKKPAKKKRKLKKGVYSFCGIVFAILACFGLVTVIVKGITMLGAYTSGDGKKEQLREFLYPAVIMDIESFDSPSELSSDQIITASIWSMIMSDTAVSGYEITFDVVNIPAADVEVYAVKLFGENLPALTHTTVGPVEARFYYNEETQSYNVPIAPVTYTYSPEIKAAKKTDGIYTVIVDYINELPEWLPETSSKTVEFKLTETSDGYTINSMKILSKSNSAA